MNDIFQECFGNCRNDGDCRECDLFDSCAYFSATKGLEKQHSGMVSFQALENWAEFAADNSFTGAEEEEEEDKKKKSRPLPENLLALSDFCRYLFSLDEYTLGILAEIIMPGDPAGNRSTADLARLHRCSRQAIHRKMLASVRRHPELADLFQLTLRKIGRGKAYFHRRELING